MKKLFTIFTLAIIALAINEGCKHYPPDYIPDINTIDTSKHDTTIVTPKRPCSSDTVYYARDIQPLFNKYCVGSGCHNLPNPAEGLNLTSFETATASSKIRPFSSSKSKVYTSLFASGGDKMPPNATMTAAEKALIKKWIDQGAKNLWCDDMVGPCDTTAVTYSGTISKIMANNCTGCHGTSGNVTLTTYAGVKAAVGAGATGKLWLAVNHFSGAVPMPSTTVKLSSCNIRQIKIWIDAGAPNN